jgi:hypothetical protein
MSALPLVLAGVAPCDGEATIAERIGDAATLISITLAVLSIFASQRAATLNRQREQIGSFDAKRLKLDLAIDAGLTVFGALLLIVAGPLFVAAAKEATPLLHTDTAFFGLFCLFYVGAFMVVLWLARTAWRRGGRLKAKTQAASLLGALFSK